MRHLLLRIQYMARIYCLIRQLPFIRRDSVHRLFLLGLISICVNIPSGARSQTTQKELLDRKTTYIYHFTKYVQWPEPDTSATFNIVILGDSDIHDSLQELSEISEVAEKKINLKRIQSIEEIEGCHILFISGSVDSLLSQVLEKAREKNILTIGDTEGYARRGIALNFVLVEERTKVELRFEMNIKALDRAGLRVSSQLVGVAILVEEGLKTLSKVR